MEEKKHGGARLGAGRKKLAEEKKKKMVSIKLSMNVIKHLDENIKNKSEYIENLIKVDMTKNNWKYFEKSIDKIQKMSYT